ncbi:MAG: hypothetical protein AAGI70_05765 [Pseudomonadota bacterium]
MKLAILFAPALAVSVGIGLVAGVADAAEVAGRGLTVENPAPQGGLRKAHDGKSGIHRTRSKTYLADPHKNRVPGQQVPEGPSLIERLFN